MESPLWIDTYAPSIDELPQTDLREHLNNLADGPINLILHGPIGSGKTAAARAYAAKTHSNLDTDLIEINVADFFNRTKKEIRDDPRFGHFLQGQTEFSKQYRRGSDKPNQYKRDWSKRAMIGHVLKEMAGYRPSSGSYKTILLDNAEAIREDFQQALRRVMERHYEATQFVITTRQPTKLIPPIQSRCFPIPVRAPTNDEIITIIASILKAESVPYEPSGIEFIATRADGDLRTAILDTQTIVECEHEITRDSAYEVLREIHHDATVTELLDKAIAQEFTDARSLLDDLLIDEGYTGNEVLESLLRVARVHDQVDSTALARVAGDIDFDLTTGTNDRLHLSHLLAELGAQG